jgi:hypothetical protein
VYSSKELLGTLLEEALQGLSDVSCGGYLEEKSRIAFCLDHDQKAETSEWSHPFSHEELKPDAVANEIHRLVEVSNWSNQPSSTPAASELEFIQPDFGQLLRVIRIVTDQTRYDYSRVVLASCEGEIQFLEVADTIEFQAELGEAFTTGFLALGLLGWQMDDGILRAHKLLFRWHTDSKLKELFDRLCEAGVKSVTEEIEQLNRDE